jgi:hypothetical protein
MSDGILSLPACLPAFLPALPVPRQRTEALGPIGFSLVLRQNQNHLLIAPAGCAKDGAPGEFSSTDANY